MEETMNIAVPKQTHQILNPVLQWRTVVLSLVVLCFSISDASAETRITYKSAKSTSSYYQMAVQIAEAMKQGLSLIHI